MSPWSPLSPRERAILQLRADGHRRREIAEELGVGSETIKTQIRRMLRRLGAERIYQAVAIALREGWIR